jgi:gliding motility-associated-like protein
MGQFTNTGNPLKGVDLTGSIIRAISSGSGGCKRIAVFSGSGRISIACDGGSSSSDNYMVQAFPKTAWGKKYLTVPTGGSQPNNIFRVCVQDPTTIVTVNGVPIGLPLQGNFFYELPASPAHYLIEADKPILVAQYLTSQGECGNGSPGDPEVIYLSPVEQNISKVLWNATPNFAITQHFYNVVIPNTGTALTSFRLDGAPVPVGNFIPHPQLAGYSYLVQGVGAGQHIIQSDSGFNAIAYGYGSAESYGYNAGTNIRDLYQFVSVQNQYATVNFPATCRSTPFYFSMTFPYQPLMIQWQFNGLFPDVTVNSPVFDSTWTVNGKQLYRYKLAAPYTINTAGTYPISVVAQNPTPDGCGGVQEIEYDLQVFTPPVADFTFTTNGCLTQPVQFTDNSNTGGRAVISRYWNFADGNTATINNPNHTYAAAGSYNVKYSLITDVGCLADTVVHAVDLSNPPAANFSVGAPYCVGKPITFTDNSTVAPGSTLAQWEWNFGDGSPIVVATTGADQVHIYAATGTYNATLKVTTSSSCESTVFTFPVIISANPVANFSFPNICLPAGAAQFTNLSTISDGTQALITYNWDFGDGSPAVTTINPLHNYAGVGPYNVTLTATSNNGCPHDTLRIVNTIYAQPDGEFTVTPENCLNAVTTFTSTSDPLPGNTVAQWNWDFADGSPLSTLQNPTHTYAAAGAYIVRHWIVTDKGCISDTAAHTVTINALPAADFNYTAPTCETKVLNFTDISAPNAGVLNSWTWNFGDGSPVSNLQNPTHTYAAAGSYTVTLQVATDKGCISSVRSKVVIVSPQPVSGFELPEVCLSDAFAQFTDTSSVASGSISSWLWDFGDPGSGAANTSILQNPQHAYAATGNYTVTLTVTTNNGCTSVISHPFTVNGDIPVADFTPLNPAVMCANDTVAIQDASTVNFGSITKIEIYWDNAGAPTVFDTDDFPAPGRIYKHKYPTISTTTTYTVRYRAYSGGACVNDRIRTIVVNAAPRVQFNNIPNICLDAVPYQINEASEIGGVPGTGVFSGPGVTAGGLFSPALVGPGTYTIKYTFTATAGGCVDTLSKTITVLEPPVADFGFINPACETQAITFRNGSSTPVGTLTTWTWDFADGSPLVVRNTGADFTHTFANYGNYDVKLTVRTNNGCNSITKLINVRVNPKPRPDFTIPASVCLPNANVTFNNLSSIADGTQSSFGYLWNFGDPGSGGANTSGGTNPSHTYMATGPFNVNLQVTSVAGCIHDTMIVLNTIHPQPQALFGVDKVDVCIGGTFAFTDNSNPLDGTITQWNWTMADGNVRNIPGFSYTYSTPGIYNVSLFIFNSQGCRSNTFTKPVFVNPYPPTNAGPDKVVLEGGEVRLTPALNAGLSVTYLWTPAAYLSDPTIAYTIASPPDDMTYTLTVTTDKNCSASDQVFIKVLKAPKIPNIFSPNGDGVHDKWVINYLETYPGCTVDIYNRYGQVIYHSVGYSQPWDGTIKGNPVPVGTYYYIVNPKNGRQLMSGYVDVIR